MALFGGKKKKTTTEENFVEYNATTDEFSLEAQTSKLEKEEEEKAKDEDKYLQFCAKAMTYSIIHVPSKDENTEIYIFTSELTKKTLIHNNVEVKINNLEKTSPEGDRKFVELTLSIVDTSLDNEYSIICDDIKNYIILNKEYPTCKEIIEVNSLSLKKGYYMQITTHPSSDKITDTFEDPESGIEKPVDLKFIDGDQTVDVSFLELGFNPGVNHDEFLIRAKEGTSDLTFILQKLVLSSNSHGDRYLSMISNRIQFTFPDRMSYSSSYGKALLGLRVKEK